MNSASKILGLSILLDPMTHDNIRGENLLQKLTFSNFSVAKDRQYVADSNFYTGWKVDTDTANTTY